MLIMYLTILLRSAASVLPVSRWAAGWWWDCPPAGSRSPSSCRGPGSWRSAPAPRRSWGWWGSGCSEEETVGNRGWGNRGAHLHFYTNTHGKGRRNTQLEKNTWKKSGRFFLTIRSGNRGNHGNWDSGLQTVPSKSSFSFNNSAVLAFLFPTTWCKLACFICMTVHLLLLHKQSKVNRQTPGVCRSSALLFVVTTISQDSDFLHILRDANNTSKSSVSKKRSILCVCLKRNQTLAQWGEEKQHWLLGHQDKSWQDVGLCSMSWPETWWWSVINLIS